MSREVAISEYTSPDGREFTRLMVGRTALYLDSKEAQEIWNLLEESGLVQSDEGQSDSQPQQNESDQLKSDIMDMAGEIYGDLADEKMSKICVAYSAGEEDNLDRMSAKNLQKIQDAFQNIYDMYHNSSTDYSKEGDEENGYTCLGSLVYNNTQWDISESNEEIINCSECGDFALEDRLSWCPHIRSFMEKHK